MKILFAAPDRDLLRSYEKLLAADGLDTVTAFDGTYVLSLMEERVFDVLVLDREIPRVDWRQIIRKAGEKKIPALLLVNGRNAAAGDSGAERPDATLSYPFLHMELISVIQRIAGEGNRLVDNDA